MKTGILLAALALPAMAFAQQAYTLKGKVGQTAPGAKAYLDRRVNGETFLDSAVIKNGSFEFKGTLKSPYLVMLTVDHDGAGPGSHGMDADRRLLYLDNATFTVASSGNISDAVITGSPVNKEFERYKLFISAYDSAMAGINKDYGSATDAQRNDTVFTNRLNTRFHAAIDEKKALQRRFISENPNSFFSVVALKELAVMNNMNLKELTPMYNSLTPALKKSPAGQEFYQSMETEKALGIGAPAPDFTQNDINDKPVKLSDFRGKYVFLDFWASWCGPCRAENPNVVAAYKKFHDKNFMVLSVSLDQPGKKAAWLGAIEKDGLQDFVHVSDLKYWDNAVARKYGVRGVPTNYLIAPDGKIIAKNLRGEQLDKQLTTLIANP
ncbi:TlpA disulfide reductase family protein [Chitinophaga sp.]|uniref:TlpA disulfide reductase family protein n=1 Tax=Chitinophaga sp. TaxID=1869181 RepID=UPI002F94B0F8